MPMANLQNINPEIINNFLALRGISVCTYKELEENKRDFDNISQVLGLIGLVEKNMEMGRPTWDQETNYQFISIAYHYLKVYFTPLIDRNTKGIKSYLATLSAAQLAQPA